MKEIIDEIVRYPMAAAVAVIYGTLMVYGVVTMIMDEMDNERLRSKRKRRENEINQPEGSEDEESREP